MQPSSLLDPTLEERQRGTLPLGQHDRLPLGQIGCMYYQDGSLGILCSLVIAFHSSWKSPKILLQFFEVWFFSQKIRQSKGITFRNFCFIPANLTLNFRAGKSPKNAEFNNQGASVLKSCRWFALHICESVMQRNWSCHKSISVRMARSVVWIERRSVHLKHLPPFDQHHPQTQCYYRGQNVI